MNVNSIAAAQPDDIFFVDPFAVELGIDADERQLPSDEIREMAVSFHIHGQRRAVECHKIDGDRLRLDHGVVRMAAARLIRSGFNFIDPESGKEVTVKDKKFKLKTIISNIARS